MLDRARELMRSGARDAAREMLAQLQEMLENLRAGTQQAQPSQGEQSLSDLQKMIQLQQQLLERSFQMDREQRQQGEQGQQRASRASSSRGSKASQVSRAAGQGASRAQMGQSAAEQEALRRALGELMRRMGEAGMEIPRALGQAEMQMRDARGALEQGQPGEAAERAGAGGRCHAAGRPGDDGAAAGADGAAAGRGPGRPAAAERPARPRSAGPGHAQRWRHGHARRRRCPRRAISAGRATCSRSCTAGPATATGAPLELDYYQRLLDRF